MDFRFLSASCLFFLITWNCTDDKMQHPEAYHFQRTAALSLNSLEGGLRLLLQILHEQLEGNLRVPQILHQIRLTHDRASLQNSKHNLPRLCMCVRACVCVSVRV